ncbi:Serine/threonine-protein kinase kin-29 [Toxocara canis]|uniref:Serine/threonine-protein kinase kin-29 n=1 Tax=Toxocara canis TaxID=6265 RepID=A0A0B2VNY3_TOXCA|nr:Serine/threonine-protein kinase kin-29 [Toxocara canis]
MQVTYPRGDQQKRRRVVERVDEYTIGKAIGKGNFAVVRLAKHSISNTKVAVKIVNKSRLDEDSVLKVDREIRILKTLAHPHIIKLYEVIRTEQYTYIVTEYAGHGEVFEMLMEKGRVEEAEARRLFQQTSAAVAYCHARGIVHRDLKAENLLLDAHNDVKLIDFGFSNFQQPQSLLSTWCGSPPYAAPELLLGKEYDGMKADVWSLGVVLYILVTGGFPFPGHSLDKLKRAVLAGQLKIPYWVSVECSDLIRKMLTFHPGKRYSIENVVQHRWFVIDESPKMQQLIRESMNSGLHPDTPSSPRLNPTVMLFMQQHTKWTEDQIIDEVKKKNYESSILATYELLCDKVREAVDEAAEASSQPRRGSRGSIVSGKANVEMERSTPTISAHHLAKLSLSANADDDSERSDTSDADDASSPGCSWAQRHAMQLSTVVGAEQPSACNNRAELRRHTLCAADPTLPLETLLLAQQIPAGSPLAAAAAAHAAAAAALVAHSPANPFANTAIPTNLLALNHLPLYTYNRILPLPSLERRASAGEALFPVNGYEQLLGTQPAINGLMPMSHCPPSSQTPLHVERRASAGEALFPVNGYEQLLGTQPAINGLMPMSHCPPSSQTPLHVERRASAGEALFPVNGYEQLLGTQPAINGLMPMSHCPPSSQTPLHGSPLTGSEHNLERWIFGSLERRASAGEALFPVNGYEQLLGTQPAINGLMPMSHCPPSSQTPLHGSPLTSVLTLEEEGERYLSQFGATKRNTVHCVGSGDAPCSTSRFVRSPYSKHNGSERRSSWTSSSQHASLVTPQQQAQLERLYKQTVAGGSDQLNAIQQLQREFQQLRASTQASPITTRTPSSLLDSSSCSLQCAPRISITDENNRCLTHPSSSTTFDPVSMFEKQAEKIVFGQRPATAIGFASTPDSCSPEQCFSPCETTAKSIVSSLEIHQVLHQLRNALDNLHVAYEETPSPLSETHRICVDNGDTGRVEIGVSSVPLSISQIKSKVDFVCSGIDIMSCGHLCSQLISKLNLPT